MGVFCKYIPIILHELPVFIKFLTASCYSGRTGILLYLFFILSGSVSRAAFENTEIGAAPMAMGNAAVACSDFPYAIHYNPAAIRVQGDVTVAFSYRNYYGLKEISQFDLITNFIIAGKPVSLGINRLGNLHYAELQSCLGVVYECSHEVRLGISFHLYHLQIKGYGDDLAWGIQGGLLVDLLPNLTLGAQVTNLNRPHIAVVGEKLPQTMSLGLSFIAIENMQIVFTVCRDVRFGAAARGGMAYQLTKEFILRAGFEDRVETLSTGCSLMINGFCFDYALRVHQILGPSHVVSVYLNL